MAPESTEPAGIVATGLTRTFRVVDRRRGLAGSLADLFRRDARVATAVDGIEFTVAPGEALALIGPNGAGKSTTVKLLTGILKPTSGSVRVDGLDPWADRERHVRRIGVVFGQRTQLWWDLAVIEALDLLAAMYGVPDGVAKARIAAFDDLLGIGPHLRTPVRQLSLGERMRCELAAALLHQPPILVLDEPTIGLDAAVKLRLRAFLTTLRDAGDTTILLTTHDLADVVALCPRVMLLSAGKLLHDGAMDALRSCLGGESRVRVRMRSSVSDADLGTIGGQLGFARAPTRDGDDGFALPVAGDAPAVLRAVLALDGVADVRIDEPPIEELIARFYTP